MQQPTTNGNARTGDRVADNEAEAAADALIGPPIDSYVSRAFACRPARVRPEICSEARRA